MALPKTVRLDGSDYDVVTVSQDELDKITPMAGPPGSFAGCIHYKDLAVYLVTKETNPSRVARNLLHECIHGMIIDSKIPRDLNEDFTIFMEARMTSFIKDNPKVIKYLQETL
jgi:hypothetical protein